MKIVLLTLCFIIVTHDVFAQTDTKRTVVFKKESPSKASLKLYPENAKDYVNIYVTFDTPTDFTLSIVSKIWTEAMEWKEHAKETYQRKIDLRNMPDGEYRVYLEHGDNTVMKKFTIKH